MLLWDATTTTPIPHVSGNARTGLADDPSTEWPLFRIFDVVSFHLENYAYAEDKPFDITSLPLRKRRGICSICFSPSLARPGWRFIPTRAIQLW